MAEGDIAVSVESFFTKERSYETIHALEDCTLYYLERLELEKMYFQLPVPCQLFKTIAYKYFKSNETF